MKQFDQETCAGWERLTSLDRLPLQNKILSWCFDPIKLCSVTAFDNISTELQRFESGLKRGHSTTKARLLNLCHRWKLLAFKSARFEICRSISVLESKCIDHSYSYYSTFNMLWYHLTPSPSCGFVVTQGTVIYFTSCPGLVLAQRKYFRLFSRNCKIQKE